MESAQQNRSLLLFKVGPYNFCAPVDRVEGVILPPAITKIPMAPPTIAGTFLFRDRAAVVVNMWQKLGLNNKQMDNPGLFIVTSLTSGLVAFKVEYVSEVIHAENLQPCKLPFANIYQLFEKFMLRGAEILLLTDFELLFASGEIGHLLNDLTELLNKRSIDTAVNNAEVAEPDVDVDAKSVTPAAIKAPDLPEWQNVTEITDSNCVSVAKIPGTIADKQSAASFAARSQVVKQKRRSKAGAEKKKNQVRKQLTRHVKAPAVISTDKIPAQTAVIPPPAMQQIMGKFYVLGAALVLGFFLLAGFYFYPHSAPDNTQVAAPMGEIIDTGKSAQLPVALSGGIENVTAEKDTEVSEIKEPLTLKPQSEPGAENMAKVGGLQGPVVAVSNATPVSQELLRLETDDFTLTVQRPVSKRGGLDSSTVSLPSLVLPQSTALAKINPQRDIVHRVVRGDTLWDIAEKYLADPYKYKDLANLSRIRDPHWIYPGDIIHIVIKRDVK